jgi:hypothetical protein
VEHSSDDKVHESEAFAWLNENTSMLKRLSGAISDLRVAVGICIFGRIKDIVSSVIGPLL